MGLSRGGNWWDASWNPFGGSTPVSPGCTNCYAARSAATLHTARKALLHLGTTVFRHEKAAFNGHLTALRAGHQHWVWPLKWPGAARPLLGPAQPSLIFIYMSDVFHEKRPVDHIDRIVRAISQSNHIGLLLTKRPERMAEYFAGSRPERKVRRW